MSASQVCVRCPRLADFLAEVRQTHPAYHAAPVESFGAAGSPFLVVGLAPGMHGANRTGRPFTGDYAGDLLYRTLHTCGFASVAAPLDEQGEANPAMQLRGCRITNAVRCLPPQNKPVGSEVRSCNPYLAEELAALPVKSAILALGTIAHQAVLDALGLRKRDFPFRHGAQHALGQGRVLFDSYHCSRYNTNTRRLTEEMFVAVVTSAAAYLEY